MTIKTKSGRLKTEDEFTDEAIDAIVEFLNDNTYEDWTLELANTYRERNHYSTLYCNEEEQLNEVLDGCYPWEILNLDWSSGYDYFSYDGYDLNLTDDVYDDVDMEELARDILNGDYHRYIPSELQDMVDEYEELLEKLNNYNEGRVLAEEVVRKYVNCEASVTDLLQALDKLAKTDEYWKEED